MKKFPKKIEKKVYNNSPKSLEKTLQIFFSKKSAIEHKKLVGRLSSILISAKILMI